MIPQSTAERLCMELFVAALVFPPWEHFFGLIALILTIGALARAIGIVVIAILSEQQEER